MEIERFLICKQVTVSFYQEFHHSNILCIPTIRHFSSQRQVFEILLLLLRLCVFVKCLVSPHNQNIHIRTVGSFRCASAHPLVKRVSYKASFYIGSISVNVCNSD